jgi:nicotinamide riboside kinase
MRIAVIGAGGTGKTTLAQRLAEELSLSFVPEFAREIISEWGFQSLKNLNDSQHVRLQQEILTRKIAVETKLDSFVSDRCTADSAAIWLTRLSGRVDANLTHEFVEVCRHWLKRYQFLILLPSNKIRLEDDGVREIDPWRQIMFEATLRGLLTIWETEYSVIESQTLEDRVSEAKSILIT